MGHVAGGVAVSLKESDEPAFAAGRVIKMYTRAALHTAFADMIKKDLEKLRRIARGKWHDPEALVSDACFRVLKTDPAHWSTEISVFRTVVNQMRNVIGDYCRKRDRSSEVPSNAAFDAIADMLQDTAADAEFRDAAPRLLAFARDVEARRRLDKRADELPIHDYLALKIEGVLESEEIADALSMIVGSAAWGTLTKRAGETLDQFIEEYMS